MCQKVRPSEHGRESKIELSLQRVLINCDHGESDVHWDKWDELSLWPIRYRATNPDRAHLCNMKCCEIMGEPTDNESSALRDQSISDGDYLYRGCRQRLDSQEGAGPQGGGVRPVSTVTPPRPRQSQATSVTSTSWNGNGRVVKVWS